MLGSKVKLISLIGRPGSGKTTVGIFLSNDFGYPIFSAGDAFRKVAEENTETGKIVKHIVENRLLTPPEVALEVIANEIEKYSKKNKVVIMDGYPRNLGQLKVASRIEHEIFFVNIEVSELVCRKRIAGAKDRGNRLDDRDERVFNQGFITFENETVPMIKSIESNSPKLFHREDGQLSPKVIAQSINLWINSHI